MINLLLSSLVAAATLFAPEERLDHAILCADQSGPRILLMDAGKDWREADAILWQWHPYQDKTIKKEHRKWFHNVSDCKTVSGGKAVLVAASGGGVALVDVATRKAVFYSYAGNNTHSAELLPDGTIAAVSSTGNMLTLFIRPEVFTDAEDVARKMYDFPDAHGCVWDKKQQLLWVLGEKFASFRYNSDKKNPSLKLVKEYHPGQGILPRTAPGMRDISGSETNFALAGHDLYPVPGTQELYLTCAYGVMTFHTQTYKFRLFSDIRHMKSISRHPVTGEVLYQIPAEKWWTDTVQTMDGKKFRLPGARFYKVRWFSKNPFSE